MEFFLSYRTHFRASRHLRPITHSLLLPRYDHELVRQRKVEQAADIQAASNREAVEAHIAGFEAAAQAEILKLTEFSCSLEKEVASKALDIAKFGAR